MWTLEAAREFVLELHPTVQKAGYHIGLTGSVLIKGSSTDDLDLVFYPTSTARQDPNALEEALRGHGLEKLMDHALLQEHWRSKGSLDTKHVETWFDLKGRRIDVFKLA